MERIFHLARGEGAGAVHVGAREEAGEVVEVQVVVKAKAEGGADVVEGGVEVGVDWIGEEWVDEGGGGEVGKRDFGRGRRMFGGSGSSWEKVCISPYRRRERRRHGENVGKANLGVDGIVIGHLVFGFENEMEVEIDVQRRDGIGEGGEGVGDVIGVEERAGGVAGAAERCFFA